ncbi:hypothetical protein Pmani_035952 [Petrolisthes manimaculis]|uniref:Uncharacterized protein n=1 Tax=Petrolisthes manimaculis TaxID=1843537 RepID=A0AAE1NKQ4_9EUCA|nr:hypothetical protein Pmani_035952 [Petrolisthes manimaculis]
MLDVEKREKEDEENLEEEEKSNSRTRKRRGTSALLTHDRFSTSHHSISTSHHNITTFLASALPITASPPLLIHHMLLLS